MADAPDVEETGFTFEDNARLKAQGIAAWLRGRGELAGTWVLADDSGIEVDALGGAPGVKSARFAGEHADDDDNNRKLVAELAARGIDRSAARYRCVLALEHDGAVDCFVGSWEVEVRSERRGRGGFGYDPHAWIEDGARTVAELDRPAKAAVSHRGRALRALGRWLAQGRDVG
jgi:XTP/dITP diphosphohydrolase